jgi:FixJ family two-component response regulator
VKDGLADELPCQVRAAAAGHIQLAPKVAACVVQEGRAPQRPDALSSREVDVLRLLGAGLANKQIGLELSISEKTSKRMSAPSSASWGWVAELRPRSRRASAGSFLQSSLSPRARQRSEAAG